MWHILSGSLISLCAPSKRILISQCARSKSPFIRRIRATSCCINIVPFIYSHMLLIQCNPMCYGYIVFTVVNFYWPWLTFFFFRSICSLGKPSLTDYQLCLMPCRIVTTCCVYKGLNYATFVWIFPQF